MLTYAQMVQTTDRKNKVREGYYQILWIYQSKNGNENKNKNKNNIKGNYKGNFGQTLGLPKLIK